MVQTAGGADDAATPGPMRRRGRRREARPPIRQGGFSTLSERAGNRTHVHARTILDPFMARDGELRGRAPREFPSGTPRPRVGRIAPILLAGSRFRARSPVREPDRGPAFDAVGPAGGP